VSTMVADLDSRGRLPQNRDRADTGWGGIRAALLRQ
jgi:hypothetical protein